MQPRGSVSRQIERPLRPDWPLDYGRLSDPILVRRAKDGDAAALEALCRRHAPRVERLAAHVLGDPEDARDAAQEALAKLCTRLRQYRGEAQFTTWLHRLVVNSCRDVAARQRQRRWEPLLDDRRTSPEPEPPHRVALAELRSELGARLATLPAAQARVLVLKDGLDWSFAEISSASGMPVGTAKCYAHRARNRLREQLGHVA